MKKPHPIDDLWRLRIAKLSLTPGDTLVAQPTRKLTEGELYSLREYLESTAPTGVAVLLLDPYISLSTLEGGPK